MSPNPFVFVVGARRSSTTLVQRLLDAHSKLAVINETRWIAEWYEARVGLAPDDTVTAEHADLLAGFSGFRNLDLPEAPARQLLEGSEGTRYADLVARIFDLYGQVHGKVLVGDKTPRYVLHLDTRQAGRTSGARVGPERYTELRYETRTSDPERACRTLCEFLGIAFDGGMLRFNDGRVRTGTNLSAKSAWLPPTPGLRDWTTQMGSRDIEAFEAAAGDLLEELGYPTVSHPSADALRRADERRRTLETAMRSGGNVLPDGWA